MTDTINIPRAELQAALDALQECRQKIAYLLGNIEWYESAQAIDFADISIKAISARLAVDVCAEKQPDVEKTAQRVEKTAQQEEKPEPVAWMCLDDPERETAFTWKNGRCKNCGKNRIPLYTAPPKRPWQGLTNEEAADCWSVSAVETWRNFEAALKEKNT